MTLHWTKCERDFVALLIKKTGIWVKHSVLLSRIFQHIKENGGDTPKRVKEWIQFKEVKTKTAVLILIGMGLKPETIPVDVHVMRLILGLGMSNGKDANEISWQLSQMIDKKYYEKMNNWIGCISQKLRDLKTIKAHLNAMLKHLEDYHPGKKFRKEQLLLFCSG